MMSDNNQLDKINSTLDEIKSLIILLNQESLQAKKLELLPEDSVKKQIYDLCDGTNTASDMASKLDKSNQYIGSYLSQLRREGIVRKIEKNGEIYHEQIF